MFIPKNGKDSSSGSRDYGPINLTSFLLKLWGAWWTDI